MSDQDDFLPLSALQHMIFYDRQAALIHVERVWMESARTVEGSDLNRVVDEGAGENSGDVLIRRGITLRSERLRLTGRAHVVEFPRLHSDNRPGCPLQTRRRQAVVLDAPPRELTQRTAASLRR